MLFWTNLPGRYNMSWMEDRLPVQAVTSGEEQTRSSILVTVSSSIGEAPVPAAPQRGNRWMIFKKITGWDKIYASIMSSFCNLLNWTEDNNYDPGLQIVNTYFSPTANLTQRIPNSTAGSEGEEIDIILRKAEHEILSEIINTSLPDDQRITFTFFFLTYHSLTNITEL